MDVNKTYSSLSIDDEMLVFCEEEVHILNNSAAIIYKLCNNIGYDELVEECEKNFLLSFPNMSIEEISIDIAKCVTEMINLGIIVE